MTAIAIRKKLVSYMQVADSKKLKAIYILLEDEIEEEHISVERYNKEIDEAEVEFTKGDYITNEAMKNKVKQW